ncbi:hypothetical protein ACFX2F_032086 [Malus domestica]
MTPPPLLYLFSPALADLLPLEFDNTPYAAFAKLFAGVVTYCIDGSLDGGLRFSFRNMAEKLGTRARTEDPFRELVSWVLNLTCSSMGSISVRVIRAPMGSCTSSLAAIL